MLNLYDIAYGLALAAVAPVWLLKGSARRKVFKAFRERMGRPASAASVADRKSQIANGPTVFIHAVSLGEINATRALVRQLSDVRPELRFVISTTTDTGHARGRELYGADPRVTLIRYPLDFTPAITRVLDEFRPSVVALMELEVWPNFIRHCHRRGIAVLLLNGRLTTGSFRNYRWVRPIMARALRRLSLVCVQDPTYADRFIALGAPRERVRVTGTMKFDTAQVTDRIDGTEQLAREVGLNPGHEPIWVCGSTGPGEEPLILRAYQSLVKTQPTLRLAIIPRKPERFDEVATLIEQSGFPLVRRSNPQSAIRNPQSPVVLGDTMGELRKFYSLATVVFVGRSLVDLGPRQHGSDMIEPAALAKPVIVGPFTHNFAEPMSLFCAADAMKVVATDQELTDTVAALLSSPSEAQAMGRRAQDVVRREQGATARHAKVVLDALRKN